MSHRRLPRTTPKWQRHAAVAAVVAVIAGAAAFAASAASGGAHGGGAAAGTHTGLVDAAKGAASPFATASSAGKPSAAGTATAKATPAAGGGTTATPKSTAKATPHASTTPTATGAATPATAPGPPHPAAVTVFTGLAFDTCTAPSVSGMSAWRAHSPYGAAAVYIGGRNRGCAQPQLSASWVGTVSAAGWKLVPIYVGAQPPCQTSGNPERITAANAASLGASDGADAVAQARALGMRASSALYLDMETYDTSDTACVNSVLTYIQSWDKALHARGYWAGFYGFTSSSAAAVAKAKPSTPDMPDALWYARYDGTNSTTTGFPFSSGLWTGHRRGHQYAVGRKETYGGVTITVDRDAWDAPVAVTG